MTTALAVRQQLTPEVWEMTKAIAPVMKNSRLFGVSTEEQAIAVMIKGYELGLSLTASFEFIHVIESKPTLSPRGALALISNHPDNAGVEIKHEEKNGAPYACTVTMKRKSGMAHTARFTMDDAKRADLIKAKSGWEKYPTQMLQWRAVGYCADVVWSDVLGGLKRSDELGADITPGGEVIEGSWTVQPQSRGSHSSSSTSVSQPQPEPPKPAFDADRLQAMLTEHGAAAIMQANGGKIPSTDTELDAITEALNMEGERIYA